MANSSWIGTMPNTAGQVAELQTSFFDLGRDKNIAYYYDTAIRLETLQEKVEQAEKNFFRRLGVSDIGELQKRLDVLNKDPGFKSMLNLDGTEFDNIVNAAFNKIDPTQPMEFIIENNKALQEELEKFGEEITVQEFIKVLNEIPNIEVANHTKIRNYKKNSKQGLGSYLGEISIVKNSSPLKVKITTKKEDEIFKVLPRKWQSRLEEFYDLKLANYDIFILIKNKVLGMIKDSELRGYVEYQLTENKNKYDLNDSKASIKGFLGEVHAAATIDYLFNNKGLAIPTGKIKNLQGREIPIDIIFEEYGFQVKNYRLIEGSFKNIRREGDAMGAANFITERLRPSASIADIMIDFFGSYQFNQPIENASDRYKQIYARFSQNELTSKIFNGYLDNILKISDDFSSINNLGIFKTPNLYFNTFFIIGDKIVPSSKILQAIKEVLVDFGNKKNSISSRFWISAPDGGITWKTNATFTGTPSTELANQVKINWLIELKVSDILNKAISKII